MALGALDLRAEEQLGDARRDRHHLEVAVRFDQLHRVRAVFLHHNLVADVGQQEVDLGVLDVVALGGEQRRDHLVVRRVGRELVFEPEVHLVVVLAAAEGAGARQQPVAPQVGPVARVVLAGQQPLDQHRPPLAGGVLEERLDLLGRGDAADDIEAGPADELVVVGVAGGDDLLGFPLLVELVVDELDLVLDLGGLGVVLADDHQIEGLGPGGRRRRFFRIFLLVFLVRLLGVAGAAGDRAQQQAADEEHADHQGRGASRSPAAQESVDHQWTPYFVVRARGKGRAKPAAGTSIVRRKLPGAIVARPGRCVNASVENTPQGRRRRPRRPRG